MRSNKFLFNIIFINFDYPFGIYKLFIYKKQTGNNYLLINIFVNFLKFLCLHKHHLCQIIIHWDLYQNFNKWKIT